MPPKMYGELASWFHLVTAPADYEEEAAFYSQALTNACSEPPKTVLELGSGGGNNASHMKSRFQMTLVDLSPGMLDLSRGLNPECEHIEGDMRSVRLGREFDAVFVHDAIDYMTTEADLSGAIETAYAHCRPGGAAIFAPDHIRETFRPATRSGGHDGSGDEKRSLRYLEWTYDPDPDDTTYTTDYAYLLRDAGGAVRVVQDRHVIGLFARATWLQILSGTGFAAEALPFEHSTLEPGAAEVFLGKKAG